jgi:hypothetical protein
MWLLDLTWLYLSSTAFLKSGKKATVMDLTAYRERPDEQARIKDLLRIVPKGRSTILDIGARDGYVSKRLSVFFKSVTALDLEKPDFQFKNVIPVKGDVTRLDFDDCSFDVVLCVEVLEHIPLDHLSKACEEIKRVAKYEVVIGVPYRQDIRIGRTTCLSCGKKNPPWGHVNSFNENKLRKLFDGMMPIATSFVGQKKGRTNALSTFLMDLAGNPWGTYDQEEVCICCGNKLMPPLQKRTITQRIFSALSHYLNLIQRPFGITTPKWIHIVFKKS